MPESVTPFRVAFLRGTAAANNSFIGPLGELTVDRTNWRLRLHDGITPGGIPIPNSKDLTDAINALESGQGSTVEILNILTSDSTEAALSAAQGKALKGLIDDLAVVVSQAGSGDVEEAPTDVIDARYVRTSTGTWDQLEAATPATDMTPGTAINDKMVTPLGLETFLSTQLGIYYDETLGDWVNDESLGA